MSAGRICVLLIIALISAAQCRPYYFFDLLFPSQSYDGAEQSRRQSVEEYGARQTRQSNYGSSASQLIDSIFQVPIQTLSSVGQLVKTTADLPGFQKRRGQRQQDSGARSSRRSRNRNYLSHAAQTAGLPVAEDGSSYKI